MGEKIVMSWQDFEQACRQLAEQINSEEIDAIICVARGGLTFGHYMGELLGLPVGVVAAEKTKTEEGKEYKVDTHVVGLFPPTKTLNFRRVLLCDDCLDGANTVRKIMGNLRSFTNVEKFTICVLVRKKNKMNEMLKEKILYWQWTDKWVQFAWEQK